MLAFGRYASLGATYVRALSTTARHNAINNVAVLGAGLMGTGIAQVSAGTGHKVVLVDTSQELLDRGMKRIEESLKRVAKKKFADKPVEADDFVASTLARLESSTDYGAAANVDLVLEAITENLGVKHQVFRMLDTIAPASCIFVSNTSSLSIGKIASVTSRLDQFAGLHFFNPVPVMKLVELVRISETSQETLDSLTAYCERLGKHVINCKDTPGFVVNRLLVPYLMEAARLVERGDASAEDVDIAMKLGAGHPMGPIALLDYVGLDTCNMIAKGWAQDYPEESLFRPVPVIERLVKEGKHGVKSGQGFYSYKK